MFECPDELDPDRIPGFEVIPVDLTNVGRVLEFRDGPVKALFDQFVREGRKGAFVVHNDVVVAHGWLTTADKDREVVNGYFPLGAHESLIHHCNVDEQVRGRRLFGMLIGHLAANQAGRVLIDTHVRNERSKRAIEQVGCHRLGAATFVAWRGRLIFCRTSPRGVLA